MSDLNDIAYLRDQLLCRQAVCRDAGRSWLHERTPEAPERLNDAAMDAETAWHWHHRARMEVL